MNELILKMINRLSELSGRRVRPSYSDGICPFELVSTVSKRSEKNRPASQQPVPDDVRKMWDRFDEIRLYEDDKYGQWGLRLLSESEVESASKDFADTRPEDSSLGDLVVGEFFGDSDLLIVRADPSAVDFGSVFVALPMDKRSEWYKPAETFVDFLTNYLDAEGEKYWEQSS